MRVRRVNTLLFGIAGAAFGLQLGAGAQVRLEDPSTRTGEPPPDNWRLVSVPASGVEFYVPPTFRRLPASKARPSSFQGLLAGEPARVHLNIGAARFETVSRSLVAMTADSTIRQVFACRLDGEPAALVVRAFQNPDRVILETVVCPRRQAISLEVQLGPNPAGQAIAEAQRLLRCLRLMSPRGFTLAEARPDSILREEVELGFTEKAREKVEILESPHYRLYTTAGSGKKLLDLLEEKLLPELTALTGPGPSRASAERLPIFLHRTREEYRLAAYQMGLPRQMADSMEGYAWDRYYSTYYSSPLAPVHIHEGTHQYMTAVLGLDGGGPWLQEGLARWRESVYERRDPSRTARNLLRARPEAFASLRELVSASTFLRSSEDQPRDRRERLSTSDYYDVAASLVSYLAQEHHNDFPDLLLHVGVLPSGHPHLIDDALRLSLRVSLTTLERAWRDWLQRS